jgi:hypothetical protein
VNSKEGTFVPITSKNSPSAGYSRASELELQQCLRSEKGEAMKDKVQVFPVPIQC